MFRQIYGKNWTINLTLSRIFAVLLVLTLIFIFIPDIGNTAESTLAAAATYPDHPGYSPVPIAFSITGDLQRSTKRGEVENHRIILPIVNALTPNPFDNHSVQHPTQFPTTLLPLATPIKAYHEACQLVDLPPPSF